MGKEGLERAADWDVETCLLYRVARWFAETRSAGRWSGCRMSVFELLLSIHPFP